MKANKMVSALPVFCLLVSLPALAQQNLVMPPPAIQAIDTHLQQSRTQKQREAMEQKRAASLPPRQTTRNKPGNPKTDAATAKPKAVRKLSKTAAAKQTLDNRNESTSATNNGGLTK